MGASKVLQYSSSRVPSSRKRFPSRKLNDTILGDQPSVKKTKIVHVTLGGESCETITSLKERHMFSLGLIPNVKPSPLEDDQLTDYLRKSQFWYKWYQDRFNARPWPLRQLNPGKRTCSMMDTYYPKPEPHTSGAQMPGREDF